MREVTSQVAPPDSVSYPNVLVKSGVLFVLLNLMFALAAPLSALGRISAYNHIFPGRLRLPYGDNPQRAYNLSLFSLEAMFASHRIAGIEKGEDEFRVVLIGDSSTWGFLLPPNQTLAAHINRMAIRTADGRRVHAYNLGYPVMSLTKDAVILSYAKRFQPDLIIWLFTLESFPRDKQLFPPLLQNNLNAVQEINRKYELNLIGLPASSDDLTLWDQTIIGRRRELADLIRLQLYGILWSATGVDQDIPSTYTPKMEDLPADPQFHKLPPPHLAEADLALQVLNAGILMAAPTPLLLINEPMFISQGENSDIRYNFYYPRWAYDDYRRILSKVSQENGWYYLDLWDSIPGKDFTNTAVHLSAEGNAQLAGIVAPAILSASESATFAP